MLNREGFLSFKFLSVFFFFACLMQSPEVCAADSSIAMILMAKGTVTAQLKGGAVRNVTRRSPLYEGEYITTGNEAVAQIRFNDDTLISLSPKTKLHLEKFQEGGKTSDNKFLANLVEGGFRIITGEIAKKNREDYKVSTPVATMSVLGTEVVIATKPNKSEFFVLSGKINLDYLNRENQTTIINLDQGTGAVVESGFAVKVDNKMQLKLIEKNASEEKQAIESESNGGSTSTSSSPTTGSGSSSSSDSSSSSNSSSSDSSSSGSSSSSAASTSAGTSVPVSSATVQDTSLAAATQQSTVTTQTQTDSNKNFYTIANVYTNSSQPVTAANFARGSATESLTGTFTFGSPGTVNWGYWDTSSGSSPWQLNSVNQSGNVFWIKSQTFLTSLPSSGSGTYVGEVKQARGVSFQDGSAMVLSGIASNNVTLDVNFSAATVSGAITFGLVNPSNPLQTEQWTLDGLTGTIGGGALTITGFNGGTSSVENASASTDTLSDVFAKGGFVSSANNMAGAFNAASTGSTFSQVGTAQGVFTGSQS
jgi:hypothetical protein